MTYMLNKMDKEQQKEHLITIMNEDAKNGLYNKPTKQTAVEWIVDQMFKQGYFDGNKPLSITNLDHLQHQAKEMEKQQIIDAHGSKLISPKGLASEYWVNGEEYYNKTFNKGQ